MAERVLETVCLKISSLLNKCKNCEINVNEAQKEMKNIMNVIINEYNEILNEHMNEIHVILSKIMFSNNVEIITVELNNLNKVLRKIILESMELSEQINWYDEVKRRMTQNDVFMSELMISHELEYEKRMEIFKQFITNEIRIKDGNNNK